MDDCNLSMRGKFVSNALPNVMIFAEEADPAQQ